VRVPEDLALIGMDDTVSGRVAEPAITTLAADSRHAGEVFSAQLVAALDGADLLDDPEPAASFRLVRRGST
jgi:LacI family transcriptional regulator